MYLNISKLYRVISCVYNIYVNYLNQKQKENKYLNQFLFKFNQKKRLKNLKELDHMEDLRVNVFNFSGICIISYNNEKQAANICKKLKVIRFQIFITNSIMPWLSQLLDVNYFYKLYVRQKIIKQGENCKYTQNEANKAFEGPSIDFSQKYANLCKTLMFTFLYSSLLPIGKICGCNMDFDNATIESYDQKFLTFYYDYNWVNPQTLDSAKENPIGKHLAQYCHKGSFFKYREIDDLLQFQV